MATTRLKQTTLLLTFNFLYVFDSKIGAFIHTYYNYLYMRISYNYLYMINNLIATHILNHLECLESYFIDRVIRTSLEIAKVPSEGLFWDANSKGGRKQL